MKIFVFFLFSLSISLFACDGDCMKCHPNLLKNNKLDANHKILAKCIECHKTSSDDLQRMGALCGQDCWDCHSIKKVKKIVNPSHMALDSCINCHEKLDKKPFDCLDEFSSKKEQNSSNFLNLK